MFLNFEILKSLKSREKLFKDNPESVFFHVNRREYVHLFFLDFLVVQNFKVPQVHFLVKNRRCNSSDIFFEFAFE